MACHVPVIFWPEDPGKGLSKPRRDSFISDRDAQHNHESSHKQMNTVDKDVDRNITGQNGGRAHVVVDEGRAKWSHCHCPACFFQAETSAI